MSLPRSHPPNVLTGPRPRAVLGRARKCPRLHVPPGSKEQRGHLRSPAACRAATWAAGVGQGQPLRWGGAAGACPQVPQVAKPAQSTPRLPLGKAGGDGRPRTPGVGHRRRPRPGWQPLLTGPSTTKGWPPPFPCSQERLGSSEVQDTGLALGAPRGQSGHCPCGWSLGGEHTCSLASGEAEFLISPGQPTRRISLPRTPSPAHLHRAQTLLTPSWARLLNSKAHVTLRATQLHDRESSAHSERGGYVGRRQTKLGLSVRYGVPGPCHLQQLKAQEVLNAVSAGGRGWGMLPR